MPLATRELELVIIARDRSTATLARIGGAVALLGAGIARIGIEGVQELGQMTSEAIEFRRQTALAFTQAEIKGVAFNDVLNLIRTSATRTSVPIDQLQELAFDIFSTLTLDNMGQAQMLMDKIAQSAVAGQAPVRDIGRAVFAWLNSLNLPPSAENVNKILDIQFELVRKGAGTYEEFASVMGRSIPSFVNADQTIEHFSATMAFLTRNGLSAANATASAGRAIELLTSPKAIKTLRTLGIRVTDADGSFRNMEEIIGELVVRMKDMDAAERRLAFKDIFGQGTIQARRFFDLVLREGNFEEFLFLLDAMRESTGAVGEAFDIMTAEPAVQLDHLRNRFQVLRQEIGDAFIPVLVQNLLPVIDRVLDVWEGLDTIQRNNIAKWAAFATLVVTIGGGLTALAGSFILILGLLKAFTGSLVIAGVLAGGWTLLVGAVAALAAGSILGFGSIGEAWDELLRVLGRPPRIEDPLAALNASFADLPTDWKDLLMSPPEIVLPESNTFQIFLDFLKQRFPAAADIVEGVVEFVKQKFPQIEGTVSTVVTNVRKWIEEDWPVIWNNIKTTVQEIKKWWDTEGAPFIEDVGTTITTFLDSLDFSQIAPGLVQMFEDIDKGVSPIVKDLWENLKRTFDENGDEIGIIMGSIGQGLINTFNFIATELGGLVLIISGILQGDWTMVWTGIKRVVGGAATFIATQVANIAETLTLLIMPEKREQIRAFYDQIRAFIEDPLSIASQNAKRFVDVIIVSLSRLAILAPGLWLVARALLGIRDAVSAGALPKGVGSKGAGGGGGGMWSALPPGGGSAVTQRNFLMPQSSTVTVDKTQTVKFEPGAIQTNADPVELANDIAFRIRVGAVR